MSLLQEIVVFLCGLLYLRLVAAQVVLPGPCPKVQALTNFQPSRYLGKWFEYEKFFFIFEAGGKCVTAEYTDLGNGTVGVLNNNFNSITERPSSIKGTATLADPSVAKLQVRFPSVPGNFAAPYWVLATDYNSYALVWSCNDLGFLHTENVWILTREQDPSPDVIYRVHQAVAKNKINKKYLMKTDHTDCSDLMNTSS